MIRGLCPLPCPGVGKTTTGTGRAARTREPKRARLGVRATSLPAETEQYLVDNGVSDPSLIVLGDLTVITDDVITQVQATTGP